MNRWTVIALTHEQTGPASWSLVVKHEFYGASLEEAVDILRAHLGADRFLADCTKDGRYGEVVCRTDLQVMSPDGILRPLIGVPL